MQMKGVLFDLGNTLADVSDFFQDYVVDLDRACFEAAGYAFTTDEMKKAVEKANKSLGVKFPGNPYRYKADVFFLELSGILGAKITNEQATEFGERFREGFALKVKLHKNALELLNYLKTMKYSLGIVSNADSATANRIVDALEIRSFFDAIVISDDVKTDKINLVPFTVALDKMGLNPGDVLMVGDNIHEDIAGASRLGIKTVLFEPGYSRVATNSAKTEKPDFIIHDLIELKGILKRL
jgi:putative hydrolase of the HAD superfamily